MKHRTRARGIALQALYEIDLVGHPLGTVIQYRLEETDLVDRLKDFVHLIVTEVWPLTQQLDEIIAVHAPEWPMDQVAIIDRNILRIALWEFGVNGDTPIKVAINEAVELAKHFGAEQSPSFINGVLDKMAREMRNRVDHGSCTIDHGQQDNA